MPEQVNGFNRRVPCTFDRPRKSYPSQANPEGIKRVKRCLRQMRYQTYELRERLKSCSPLGSLLLEIRRILPQSERKLGVQSVRKLEAAGLTSLKDLVPLGLDELVGLGLQRAFAEQVIAYVR